MGNNNGFVTENAVNNIDKKKYDENYDRIFGNKKEKKETKNYVITIEFQCTKEDLEGYTFDYPETIGDVERNVVKLFSDDYLNVSCKIRPIND